MPLHLLASIIVALLLVGCGQGGSGNGTRTTTASTTDQPATETAATRTAAGYSVETVVEGLEVPWAIAFLPDGRMLVTEREGRVRVVENGTLRAAPFATIDDVEPTGESGLMALELHPSFAQNHFLYISYAYKGEDDQMVRVVRFRETPTGLVDRTTIIEGIPAARNHAGCRLRFGPDGKLYITTGDATDRNLAQQLGSLAGKTLRLNDDGSVPSDNPFIGRAGARPEIWSYGHRNAQGIDFQPGTGMQVQTEHGPSGFDGPGGGDEVNIIEKGMNYGWPTVHHTESMQGMISPVAEYTPAAAPGSGMFYSGTRLANYTGSYFFGALRGESIYRLEFEGKRVARQERMFEGVYGRIRDIVEGPDGAIYFSTSNRDGRGDAAGNDDRIMRIVKKE